MRFLVAAFVLSLAAWAIAGETGANPTASAPSAPGAGPNDTGSSDAARHAKRTECLRQAKARKLVGADKNTYVKTCLAAP